MKRKWVRAGVAVLVAVVLMAVGMGCLVQQVPEEFARSYTTNVYREQGGDKLVVASGGELEVQSGGTLDLQSGATTDFSSGIDLDGGTLTIDADADTTLAEGSDDVISTTLGAATGYFNVLTGNLKVGNGTPGVSLDGEDAYVEGTFEVDGAAQFDGALTASSTLDAQGDVSDSAGDFTVADNAVITGTLDVQGGDITLENDETIANGTNGVVQVGGFLALTEGSVVEATAGGTITPLGSFQPITSAAVTTNAVIADGSVAGQIVVISNENASDDITILESGSNLAAGGDITLTGGAYDLVTLIWDGSRWIRQSFEDN